MKSILLVSPEQEKLESICSELSDGFKVDTAVDLDSLAGKLKKTDYDIVFLDASLLGEYHNLLQHDQNGGPMIVEFNEPYGRIPTLAEVRKNAVELIERTYLVHVLAQHAGRINKTSEATGISCRQLHKLMTKYGIHKEHFKEPSLKSGVRRHSFKR